MKNLIRIWKNKNQIMEGIVNSIFKDSDVEDIANERKKICDSCLHIDLTGEECAVIGTQPCCSLCGCSLSLKTRSLSTECPINKWEAELTQDEEDLLTNSL